MVSPSSAVLSKIFLQYSKWNYIVQIGQHKLLGYIWYVDMIVYDHNFPDINIVLQDFN